MKILVIVLFIAAIGGVAYYYSTKEKSGEQEIQKELILGKWKMDSINIHEKDSAFSLVALALAMDSNSLKYHYDFRSDSLIFVSLPDSALYDTSAYKWKENKLLWRENLSDTAWEELSVTLLTKDSLNVQSKDSTIIFFIRPQ